MQRHLICEGVFEKFPDFKFALIEAQQLWAVSVMWHLDTDWKATTRSDPMAQTPAERVFPRAHPNRFTTDARAGKTGADVPDVGDAARRRDADILLRLPALRLERSGSDLPQA